MESLADKVKKIIEEELSPRLAMHGGGVEVVKVDEKKGIAELKFIGMCAGCPLAGMTFESMVEGELLAQIPELKKVEANNLMDSLSS